MIQIFIDENNPATAKRLADLERELFDNHDLKLVDVLRKLTVYETVKPEEIVNGPGRDIEQESLPAWVMPKYDKAELNTKGQQVPDEQERNQSSAWRWTATSTFNQLNVLTD